MSAPYVAHSETSYAAAVLLTGAETLRQQVHAHIEDSPSTDEEIQLALRMAGNTERPRRRELEQAGRVMDSGQRRLTRSGRQAVVWTVRSPS